MKKYIILITVFFIQPALVVQAYQERGYFAIGGEWFLIPGLAFVAYGLRKTFKEFYTLFKNEEGKNNE